MDDSPTHGLPDLKHLMASVIRLQALCAERECPSRRQTLTHLLNYLLKHPGLQADTAALAAVRQAAEVNRASAALAALPLEDGTFH